MECPLDLVLLIRLSLSGLDLLSWRGPYSYGARTYDSPEIRCKLHTSKIVCEFGNFRISDFHVFALSKDPKVTLEKRL